jgi:hypothetical protein
MKMNGIGFNSEQATPILLTRLIVKPIRVFQSDLFRSSHCMQLHCCRHSCRTGSWRYVVSPELLDVQSRIGISLEGAGLAAELPGRKQVLPGQLPSGRSIFLGEGVGGRRGAKPSQLPGPRPPHVEDGRIRSVSGGERSVFPARVHSPRLSWWNRRNSRIQRT